jgi:hypothetical protein
VEKEESVQDDIFITAIPPFVSSIYAPKFTCTGLFSEEHPTVRSFEAFFIKGDEMTGLKHKIAAACTLMR